MKKLFVVSTLGFLICLLLSSCYDNPSATDNINDEFIRPLAIGNYWIYDLDSTTIHNALFYCDTMRVVSYENLNGNPAYGIKYNTGYTFYFNNKSDGHYFFQNRCQDAYEYLPMLYIKYPIRVNDSIISTLTGNFKCVSTTATFNGFNGCIDLIPLENVGDSTSYHEYWKPGIGFIGSDSYFLGKHHIDRLVAYRIN
jgi:hypothetical protein